MDMILLWVDDQRLPPKGWIWAKTYKEAKAIIEANHGNISHMSLDHDLAGEYFSGYDLVKWMVSNGYTPTKKIIVHSANPVGRANMVALLVEAMDNNIIPQVSVQSTIGIDGHEAFAQNKGEIV